MSRTVPGRSAFTCLGVMVLGPKALAADWPQWGGTASKNMVADEKGLHVLAAGKEAKLLAKINVGSPIYASPIAANGTLYIARITDGFGRSTTEQEPKP